MYQTIDDIKEPEDANLAPPHKARFFLTLIVITGFSVILAVAVWTSRQTPNITAHPAEQNEATTAFRNIQEENRPAIRRALLLDYVDSYKQSSVINSAKAQLRVMDDYEAADWAKLSDVMFAENQTPLDKKFEFEHYISIWGESLLGSRDKDITAFRAALDNGEDTPIITRAFIPEKSPIPDTIDASQMAGGRVLRPITPSYIPPAPRELSPPAPLRQSITPARIRRNRAPDYPRRAYRRSIPAVVELSLNIDERGRVGLIELISIEAPRYSRDFERAARRAAKHTRFHPQLLNGTPIPARDIRKTYVFDPSR